MFNKKFFQSALLLGVLAAGMSIGGVSEAADYPAAAEVQAALEQEEGTVFPLGGPNVKFEKYFTGQTYLAGLASDTIGVSNVTFIDGAHTYWHKHHGSCQILVTESGRGYYQIWGEEPQELVPGVVATIPENVKHWHGAAPGSYMQHLSIMQHKEGVSTEWLEPVDESFFAALK